MANTWNEREGEIAVRLRAYLVPSSVRACARESREVTALFRVNGTPPRVIEQGARFPGQTEHQRAHVGVG